MPWIGDFPCSASTERGPAGGRATNCASDLHDGCSRGGKHHPAADVGPVHEPPLATLERRCGGSYRLGFFCDPLRDVKLSTNAPRSGALIMASDKLCQSIQAPRRRASEAMTNRVVHIRGAPSAHAKAHFKSELGRGRGPFAAADYLPPPVPVEAAPPVPPVVPEPVPVPKPPPSEPPPNVPLLEPVLLPPSVPPAEPLAPLPIEPDVPPAPPRPSSRRQRSLSRPVSTAQRWLPPLVPTPLVLPPIPVVLPVPRPLLPTVLPPGFVPPMLVPLVPGAP